MSMLVSGKDCLSTWENGSNGGTHIMTIMINVVHSLDVLKRELLAKNGQIPDLRSAYVVKVR